VGKKAIHHKNKYNNRKMRIIVSFLEKVLHVSKRGSIEGSLRERERKKDGELVYIL